MYLDKQALFSDAQALTTTAVSTNIIDLGSAEDASIGNDLKLFCSVGVALTGGTSVAVSIQTATDAAFTSPVTLVTTAAIAAASLVAGYKFSLPIVPFNCLRYLRLNYTIVGTFSAGSVDAGLVIDTQNEQLTAGNQPV